MRLTGVCCVLILVNTLACADKPRSGQPPTVTQTYGFLTGQADSRIVKSGVLEITFETAEPTPPAVVYYGINDIAEHLDYARYRKKEIETGDVDALRQRHVIRVPFQKLLQSMPNTPFEPRICWRAEVYLPTKRTSRFVEGRQYFDPKTLGDAVNVTMGPFVEQITANSAVITFETDREAVGRVTVGDKTITSAAAQQHAFDVTGLQPDTVYQYHVEAGETRVRPYAFKTAGSGAFQFAAMVDSREGVGGGMRNAYGVNAFALYALASDAYFRGAAFILFPGDLINGYTTSKDDFRNQLDSFRRSIGPVHARIPVYEGMGNHEALLDIWDNGAVLDKPGADSAEAVFADVFTNPRNGPEDEGEGTPTYAENVYFFDYGSARFFVLNNNYWYSKNPRRDGGNLEGYFMPKQIEWLREQIAKADRDSDVKTLYFAGQEPPFPNGGHTDDSMWYRGGDTNGDGKADKTDVDIIENRNAVWELIASSPKSVAFITGDEHAYSRILIRPETPVGHKRKTGGGAAVFRHPVWQITTGGAGAPWYDKELDLPWSGELAAHSTQPHYAMFKVDGDAVALDVYGQTGEKIDSCQLRPLATDDATPERQMGSPSGQATHAQQPAISLDELQPIIRWQDAGKFMGREVQVVGPVAATGRSKTGHAFLNFRDESTDVELTGFIHSKAAELFETPPEEAFKGKMVKIRGDLYLYDGKPNIRIAAPSRITILPPDTPLPERVDPPKAVQRTIGDTISVAAYNVMNLFDSLDDGYRSDEGTRAKQRGELEALAQSIRRLDADVLALAEVENRGILEQFNAVLLPDMGYTHVVHFEGNDRRGIDVAFLSRLPVGPVTSYRHLEFPDANGELMKFRRDLLRVRIEPEDGKSFDVFAVHLKSKGGLGGEAEEVRLGEAMMLRRVLDEILAQNGEAPFLVCGDFNDEWSSRSMRAIVGTGETALTGFVDQVSGETDVTYNQKPYLSMIDFILASPAMARRHVEGSYRILPGSPSTSGSDHNPVIARFRIR